LIIPFAIFFTVISNSDIVHNYSKSVNRELILSRLVHRTIAINSKYKANNKGYYLLHVILDTCDQITIQHIEGLFLSVKNAKPKI
jgi:hypothetical protein